MAEDIVSSLTGLCGFSRSSGQGDVWGRPVASPVSKAIQTVRWMSLIKGSATAAGDGRPPLASGLFAGSPRMVLTGR